jgi:hypothetical protein
MDAEIVRRHLALLFRDLERGDLHPTEGYVIRVLLAAPVRDAGVEVRIALPERHAAVHHRDLPEVVLLRG